MVYATGGVAYGKVKTYVNAPFDEGSSLSDTRVGYTVGAGAEYALTNNVTLKTEYLYTDLGKLKFNVSDDIDTVVHGAAKSQFHTVRVGLNYKF
jgi:outer membrane immunogenic protein